MTMVMVTSLTITKEKEYGTMESLLATPVTSLEIIFGKITPYNSCRLYSAVTNYLFC